MSRTDLERPGDISNRVELTTTNVGTSKKDPHDPEWPTAIQNDLIAMTYEDLESSRPGTKRNSLETASGDANSITWNLHVQQ